MSLTYLSRSVTVNSSGFEWQRKIFLLFLNPYKLEINSFVARFSWLNLAISKGVDAWPIYSVCFDSAVQHRASMKM
jgi:hypothetical protein